MLEHFLLICLFANLQQQKYIFVFTNSAIKSRQAVFASESILHKMLVSFFSSIFLYIETNPVEKLCKVLEMELKKYTPFDLKFVFEKM